MSISASTVKELRDQTGAGMMDCKKALTEAEGDAEKGPGRIKKKRACKGTGQGIQRCI